MATDLVSLVSFRRPAPAIHIAFAVESRVTPSGARAGDDSFRKPLVLYFIDSARFSVFAANQAPECGLIPKKKSFTAQFPQLAS